MCIEPKDGCTYGCEVKAQFIEFGTSVQDRHIMLPVDTYAYIKVSELR